MIGSRDYTFRGDGASAASRAKRGNEGNRGNGGNGGSGIGNGGNTGNGKQYIDENLFVCRAVVVGVEGEPMRVVEKTKRRQRKVRRMRHKGRFTVLRVREVRVLGEGGGRRG